MTGKNKITPRQFIELPAPNSTGNLTVEKAIKQRRSTRSFSSSKILSLEALAQLLWAAQGVTSPQGFHTIPSAGGLNPIELYVVTGQVSGLEAGVYRYNSELHNLALIQQGDLRAALSEAALEQSWIADGQAVLVFAGIYERTTGKYGPRGRHYVHIEIGHAAQNIYLQAAALGLGTVIVGAFNDREVQNLLGMGAAEEPLALMPVGFPGGIIYK